MNNLTREQAERIVSTRKSLCCGLPMKLEVIAGFTQHSFSAWAKCPNKHSMTDSHEQEVLGDLIH